MFWQRMNCLAPKMENPPQLPAAGFSLFQRSWRSDNFRQCWKCAPTHKTVLLDHAEAVKLIGGLPSKIDSCRGIAVGNLHSPELLIEVRGGGSAPLLLDAYLRQNSRRSKVVEGIPMP